MPRDGTRVIRAGQPPAAQGEAFLPGPVLAAPFHLGGDPAGAENVYGRYGNPTWRAYEDALGELEGLRYPGLPADPAHALASRQMSRFGTVVAFDLGTQERAEGFLEAADLVTDATSFGGVRTTAERRARWGGDRVPAGFVRLSAGCEDPEDLLRDVARALDSSR